MAIKNKCKYCLAPLDKNGDCSGPCAPGKLKRDLRLKQTALDNANKNKVSEPAEKE